MNEKFRVKICGRFMTKRRNILRFAPDLVMVQSWATHTNNQFMILDWIGLLEKMGAEPGLQ